MTLLALLRRGLLAGGIGGLLTGVFGLVLSEPLMDRAVRLEEARAERAGDHAEHAEVFTRSTQHLGLLVAAVATGLALGVLFSVVYALVYRDDPGRDPWRRALVLGGSGFLGVGLLPFLRYPANPPGVGDTGTVSMRTSAWLAAIVIGLVAVAVMWRLSGWLSARGAAEPLRHLAVAAVPVLALVAMFVALPDNPDPLPVPAGLLWTFRLLALASTTVLWAGLGVAFGLLGYRAGAAVAATADPAAPDARRVSV